MKLELAVSAGMMTTVLGMTQPHAGVAGGGRAHFPG